MTSESQAAEGVHASAAPELPLLQGITQTAALSSAEGSSLGLPAGFTATPEVQPLRSEAKSGYTSTSTKHSMSLPVTPITRKIDFLRFDVAVL